MAISRCRPQIRFDRQPLDPPSCSCRLPACSMQHNKKVMAHSHWGSLTLTLESTCRCKRWSLHTKQLVLLKSLPLWLKTAGSPKPHLTAGAGAARLEPARGVAGGARGAAG